MIEKLLLSGALISGMTWLYSTAYLFDQSPQGLLVVKKVCPAAWKMLCAFATALLLLKLWQ